MMVIYEPSSTKWVAASHVQLISSTKGLFSNQRFFLHRVAFNIMAGISTYDLHSIYAKFKLQTDLFLTKSLFYFI